MIDGISKVPIAEEFGTTSFVNEAAVCAEAPQVKIRDYSTLRATGDVDSVKNYLGRPVAIFAGTIGATPGSLAKLSLGTALEWANALTGTNFSRLRGCTGFRATLVFDVAFTRSAFNQGIVSLNFQYGINSTLTGYDRATSTTFPLSVHLPNTRINLADETMGVLRVPFVYYTEYIPIDTGFNDPSIDYGVFTLVNLTGSRVVAGQSAPTYTVYLHLEDIELIGSSPFSTTTVTLQSGLASRQGHAVRFCVRKVFLHLPWYVC